jgi:hypothetical protein
MMGNHIKTEQKHYLPAVGTSKADLSLKNERHVHGLQVTQLVSKGSVTLKTLPLYCKNMESQGALKG